MIYQVISSRPTQETTKTTTTTTTTTTTAAAAAARIRVVIVYYCNIQCNTSHVCGHTDTLFPVPVI